MKITSLATILSLQAPNLMPKLKNDDFLVISPLEDEKLSDYAGSIQFARCEMGSVSYVLLLVCKELFGGVFDDIDEGFLSGESNIGEEEIASIANFIKTSDKIIISDEIMTVNKEFLISFLSLISAKFGSEVVDLELKKVNLKSKFDLLKDFDTNNIDELLNFDGAVVFTHNNSTEFRGGELFMIASKIKDGTEIAFKIDGIEFSTKFNLDKSMKGTIATLGGDFKYGFHPLNSIRAK